MNKLAIFEPEFALVEDKRLKEFLMEYFTHYVPDYFWEIGASSSGKYHPSFAKGEGGLVRHTKAVVMFANELLRMNTYAYMKDIYKEYVIVACLCHDTCKYGDEAMDTTLYSHHGSLAEECMRLCWFNLYGEELPALLGMAVNAHMGQWSTDDRPFSPIDRCVHLADYMASRDFIDIPSLHEAE